MRVSRVYSRSAHFASAVLFDVLLVRCVPPVAFAIVTYEAVGLRETSPEWSLVGFAVALCALSAAATLAAVAVGALRPSASAANALGALYALGTALFGGYD